jgi:hypothetical protein
MPGVLDREGSLTFRSRIKDAVEDCGARLDKAGDKLNAWAAGNAVSVRIGRLGLHPDLAASAWPGQAALAQGRPSVAAKPITAQDEKGN